MIVRNESRKEKAAENHLNGNNMTNRKNENRENVRNKGGKERARLKREGEKGILVGFYVL